MLELNFHPFPALETQRLLLRELNLDDADNLFLMRSSPSTMKYIPRPLAQTREDAVKLIRAMKLGVSGNDSINWAITLKDKPGLIGVAGFVRISREAERGELGYLLHEDFHGQGIMHETLQPIIRYGWDVIGFHTQEGVIDPANTASEKLLLKNGFVKEAHFRENLFYEGRWLDSVHYTLFRE